MGDDRMNEVTITLNKFESSNIKSIHYDIFTKDLIVGFKNGSKYRYPNISLKIFNEFTKSKSKGKFFFKNIKHLKNEKIKEKEK